MKKILVTGATDNYYPYIIEYLLSIDKNSNFDDNVLITLDFHQDSFSRVKHCYLDNALVENKNPNNCLQHGEFIKCDYFQNLEEEDIICFTDGDVFLQRGLSEEEISKINSLQDDEVLVQWNLPHGGTLLDEYHQLSSENERLGLSTIDYKVIENDLNIILRDFSCFNTGVMIANLKTWKKIKGYYSVYYPQLKDIFAHYAKQQWILSFILGKYLKPILMDYSSHVHYHLGRTSGTTFVDSEIYYENKKVLFNHFCMDLDLPQTRDGFKEQQKRILNLHA
jgi:hypothetical protein